MRLKTLVVSLSLICIAQDVSAQQRSSNTVALPAGTRVRVKTASLVAPLVANFLEQRGDTLVFIEDGRGRGVWSFAIGQIEKLETTAGDANRNMSPISRGAAIGAGVGLVGGFLFAVAVDPSDSTKQYSKALTGLVGAAVGGGVGALAGSRVKHERWIDVPLHRQLSLRMNGRKVGLAFEFR